eukprot:scaffold351347_cov67-Attheya_sp.AAC.1
MDPLIPLSTTVPRTNQGKQRPTGRIMDHNCLFVGHWSIMPLEHIQTRRQIVGVLVEHPISIAVALVS